MLQHNHIRYGIRGGETIGQQPTFSDAFDAAVEENNGMLPFSQKAAAIVFGRPRTTC